MINSLIRLRKKQRKRNGLKGEMRAKNKRETAILMNKSENLWIKFQLLSIHVIYIFFYYIFLDGISLNNEWNFRKLNTIQIAIFYLFINRFNFFNIHNLDGTSQNTDWNFDQNGADWQGICATGFRQSPMKLSVDSVSLYVHIFIKRFIKIYRKRPFGFISYASINSCIQSIAKLIVYRMR